MCTQRSPTVYATITDADPVLVSRTADVLELRAADPQQRVMRETYLRDIAFPAEASVLDLGCGTGAATRVLAGWPGIGVVVGVDPHRRSWPAPEGLVRRET
jgi:SAM-dependent methyltransferase